MGTRSARGVVVVRIATVQRGVAIVEPGAYDTNILNTTVGPEDLERLATYGEVGTIIEQIGAGFAASAGNPIEVAETIAALVAAPAHSRPLRTLVPAGSPVEGMNAAAAPIQRALLENFGLGALLPQTPVAV